MESHMGNQLTTSTTDPHIHLENKDLATYGHFTLGVGTKEIQELSNPIGGELKIPKGLY
jgi:hypothetical protein